MIIMMRIQTTYNIIDIPDHDTFSQAKDYDNNDENTDNIQHN